MMEPDEPQKPAEPVGAKEPQTVDRIEVYRKLSRISDKDALHQLIAAHGTEILDRGLPYVLIAARNWKRSAIRRGASHTEVPVTDLEIEPSSSLWDPFQQLEQKEALRSVTDALAQLEDPDFLVIWRHAEGYSDLDIQREWNELGFDPPRPAVEYLRKRRQRARERLRKILHKP